MNDGVYRPGPLLVDVAGTYLTDADVQVLTHRAVGGVILFTRNFENREQLAELTTAAREIGWLLAVELARVGVDMPLAPVVDLDYGFSEVIGDRAFAGDADTVLALSRALAQGLRDAGSVATAKHFPG